MQPKVEKAEAPKPVEKASKSASKPAAKRKPSPSPNPRERREDKPRRELRAPTGHRQRSAGQARGARARNVCGHARRVGAAGEAQRGALAQRRAHALDARLEHAASLVRAQGARCRARRRRRQHLPRFLLRRHRRHVRSFAAGHRAGAGRDRRDGHHLDAARRIAWRASAKNSRSCLACRSGR